MPFFSQRRKQCGAASLATVLAFHGEAIDAKQLEPLLYIPGKQGTLAIEIQAQAREFGYVVYSLEPFLKSILAEVAAGNPVLVMQNLGLSFLPQWHFAVVVGYDTGEQSLILRSGNERRHVVAMKTFINTWERAGHWAIVITPSNEIPATAEPVQFLKAAAELEEHHSEKAEAAYIAALEHWPEDPNVDKLARLGLFNIAYSHKRYAAASAWLLRHPGPVSADHWNNLAFSLIELGCGEQALLAVRCALAMQPENRAYQASLSELRQRMARGGAIASKADMQLCGIPGCVLSTD